MSYIDSTAIFGENVILEEDVYIGPYCIIGYPAEWKGKENENAGVIIRKGTRITGHVTIDAGAITPTEIGENCYILKKSHIGHDAKIGDNTTLSCHSIVGGHTIIGRNCNIGLGAILHQKINVPDFTMIGMGGIVTKKSILKSFNTYVGNPVKWLCENKYLINEFKEEYDRYIQNTISK